MKDPHTLQQTFTICEFVAANKTPIDTFWVPVGLVESHTHRNKCGSHLPFTLCWEGKASDLVRLWLILGI